MTQISHHFWKHWAYCIYRQQNLTKPFTGWRMLSDKLMYSLVVFDVKSYHLACKRNNPDHSAHILIVMVPLPRTVLSSRQTRTEGQRDGEGGSGHEVDVSALSAAWNGSKRMSDTHFLFQCSSQADNCTTVAGLHDAPWCTSRIALYRTGTWKMHHLTFLLIIFMLTASRGNAVKRWKDYSASRAQKLSEV